MGAASKYFVDRGDPERQTLHRRIRPSKSQFEEQQARWNALKDYLLPNLGAASGYSMRSWLQGSYKFGTQIRPLQIGGEFDIDLGVYYCWSGAPEDGAFGPKALKQFVQNALIDFREENEDVEEVCAPPKPRCCRIRFSGAFHIDVPCYHLDPDADSRALATEADGWEDSDPKALYTWFTGSFEPTLRDTARRHIRYLKAWATLNLDDDDTRPPSSVLLTILVAEALLELGDDTPSPEDEAFAAIVGEVLERVSDGQDVRNPVDADENIAERMEDEDWDAFTDALEALRRTANEAVAADTETDACSIWADAFHHAFPLPEEDTTAKSASGLPALRAMPEVAVSAVSRDNDRFRYNAVNAIGPIPKNCDIRFRVTNLHAMPAGVKFRWVVRNQGEEAEDTNDLGHHAGTGMTASEHSAYNGTHYMDCTAMVGTAIVGLRRVKVTVRGQRAPKRHFSKPAYVSLHGRR